jgi:hypothetical protein
MGSPGEVNQAVGQAYQYVFIAALEANIVNFENNFHVHLEPEKTSFRARTGRDFSFDFSGVYNLGWRRIDVFGESKGYSKARNLLAEFRAFLAKAYVTTTDYPQNSNDYFWFVTNVPFACSEGSGIKSYEFVRETLNDKNNPQVQEILGEGHVDDQSVRDLVGRLGVFILTDSYLRNTRLSYKVRPGESSWTILKRLYGGSAPAGFRGIAEDIARKNGLPSADLLASGKRLKLDWQGIRGVNSGF